MGCRVTEQPNSRPGRVLLLYYSYTGQAKRVLEAAGDVFRDRGFEVCGQDRVHRSALCGERFSRFPMRNVWPDFLSMLPAQTLRSTGDIRTPDEVRDGTYDLICIGSPTWWRTVSMPLRSFLTSHEARPLLDGTPFAVFVVCRRYWRENLGRSASSPKEGRSLHRQHPFRVPGWSAALHAVVDQLSRLGRVSEPLPGYSHSDHQRQH